MPGASYFRSSEQAALAGPRTFYTGTGKLPATGKVSLTGKRKRGGFAALIVTLLIGIGGGAFLSSSNSLLAPAMEALFTEKTDTQYTSSTLRTRKIIQYMLKGDYPVNHSWLGANKYNHFSSSFKKRLAKNNIEVVGSGSNKTLRYTNPTTNQTIDVTADQFDTVFRDNLDFRDAYTTSTRGRVANFFDAAANRIYQKLGISRNLFDDYRQTGDADADMDNYRDTMSEKFEGSETDLIGRGEIEETETDQETGESETIIVDHDSDGDVSTTGSSAEATSRASDFLNRVVGTLSSTANFGCAALTVGNMISIAVAANEIYQSINYFMGLMENVSKMKAGDGDESAINSVLNFMSTPATTQVEDYQNPNITGSGDDVSVTIDETEPITGTPLEAKGVQMILADAPTNAASTANYSLERASKVLGGALTTAGASLAACSVLQGGAAIASIAVSLIPGVGQAKILGGFFLDVVLGVVLDGAISLFLAFLIPTIAQSLFTNVFENATGIPAGELFTRGASAANTRVGRSGSGQSPSGEAAAVAYNQTTSIVLAQDAELDRYNHSPFDISNQNTFFGSIAYSLLPAATSSQATSLANLLRTTSSSLSSLVGGVSAAGEGTTYMTTFGDCPNLESIGAVGDIYCNPVTTTDVSTINIEPNDTEYVKAISSQVTCDDEDNCTINDGSDLGKYIAYCAERDSPFGIADANILNDLSVSNGLGTVGGSIIGSLPIVGDILTLLDSGTQLAYMDWATGANCVNTEKNQDLWNSKMKYYQRYVEDQRILTQLGAYDGETDPVTAYVEKREAELPYLTDNTPAGYLARISGITKDDAETVLALAEYYTFIAEYDAGDRLAMTGDATTLESGATIAAQISTEHYRYTDNAPVHSPETPIISTRVLYSDIRNRNYAA